MKRLAAAAGTAVLVAAASAASPAEEPALHLFFSTETPELARVLRDARAAAGRLPFRPVFLPDREGEPPEEFLEALEGLDGDAQMIDPEGLALARRAGIRSTPCAVRTGRRLHKACGTRIDWKEFMSCD